MTTIQNKNSKKIWIYLGGLLLIIIGQHLNGARVMAVPVMALALPTVTPILTPTVTLSPTVTYRLTPTAKITPTDRFIFIDQSQQMMHLFEKGKRMRVIPVSTGMGTISTTTISWRGKVGQYLGGGAVVGNMYVDDMWFLFPDLYGLVLIHTVPYTKSGQLKQYDQLDALGNRPASHGCVRISPQDAQWLKTWNPVGVPIEISRRKIDFQSK